MHGSVFRKPTGNQTPHAERVPQVVLRFALVTAGALAITTALIILIVRHYQYKEAEASAVQYAGYTVENVVAPALQKEDLARRVTASRRRTLDGLFAYRSNPQNDVSAVWIVGADGRITYSTHHGTIGHVYPSANIAAALAPAATATSEIGRLGAVIRSGGPGEKVLAAYVPIILDKHTRGVIVFALDYSAVTSSAQKTVTLIEVALEVSIVVLLVLLAPVLSNVKKRIHQQIVEIQFRSAHDDLTGLANRIQFADEISNRLKSKPNEPLAVFLIDLDRFKEINDTLGHGAGDELLLHTAERLRESVQKGDVVARLGGDEFGVVMWGDASVAKSAARRICRILSEPFTISGLKLSIEGSVGIAVAPEHGTHVQELLQHSDVAMYIAKSRHTGSELYSPGDDPSDSARITVLAQLRDALSAGDLVAYFQAKVDMRSGLICGAETLVRWRHPIRGIIGPGEFLPSAQQTGLGKELNRFILEEAIRRCADWNQRGLDLNVAVNLTMLDLLDLGLPELVADVLQRHRLAPGKLTLEITETIIMADRERVTRVLRALESTGVRLSIDDFGTGFSSLAHLRDLPIHEVKVDQSFVRGALTSSEDAQVVRWTIGLGQSLGLSVVAEGVELMQQWKALESLGCDIAQGYLISKPLPNGQFVDFVTASFDAARGSQNAPRALA